MFACSLSVGRKASSHYYSHVTPKVNAFGRLPERSSVVTYFHLMLLNMQNYFTKDEN
jgi:hypothetical protein